jgi:hypothetical protein
MYLKVKDGDYVSNYEDQLGKMLKSFSVNNKHRVGIYINFAPKFASGNKSFDVDFDYEDNKKDGSPGKIYKINAGKNKAFNRKCAK